MVYAFLGFQLQTKPNTVEIVGWCAGSEYAEHSNNVHGRQNPDSQNILFKWEKAKWMKEQERKKQETEEKHKKEMKRKETTFEKKRKCN